MSTDTSRARLLMQLHHARTQIDQIGTAVETLPMGIVKERCEAFLAAAGLYSASVSLTTYRFEHQTADDPYNTILRKRP